MPSFKLAIDAGGSYTDFCLLGAGGELHVFKEPSTPEEPARAVASGLTSFLAKTGVNPGEIDFVLLGASFATNAILERTGAPTALLTTKGFRDILYIGRQNRPHVYDFRSIKPPPLIPRRLIMEVNERILADGSVFVPLSDEEIQNLLDRVEESGVTSVAVCLLHSYANPEHEQVLKDALQRRFPSLSVSISSETLPQPGEYERTSATVIDAYIKPLTQRQIELIKGELSAMGIKSELFVVHSGGGVITTSAARRYCALLAQSEAAGSALAGISIASSTPHRNLLTADMGGTGTNICLVDQARVRFTTQGGIAGFPFSLPMLDTMTISAGGSNVAWVDAGGVLRVGPPSAGLAGPGPVCFDRGGEEPTVTDANVVLGRLAPEDLKINPQLKPDLAALAISLKICAPLGLSLEEAAERIIKLVNTQILRAIRRVSVERGFDPRLFTFVPFGSVGTLHAVELAAELAIPRVLITPYPGVGSAKGMLAADVRHYYTKTRVMDFVPEACGQINEMYDRLVSQAGNLLRREGFADKDISYIRLLDLRYKGQPYDLSLIIPANSLLPADIKIITRRFHREHLKLYGNEQPDAPLESVTLRLRALGALPKENPPAPPGGGAKAPGPISARDVWLAGSYQTVPVFSRSDCGRGVTINGPAVITREDATALIWPGNRATCDRWGNLLIVREEDLP